MNRSAFVALGFAGALALAAAPAAAQHRGGDGGREGGRGRESRQASREGSRPAQRAYSGRYYGPRYVGPRFSIAPRRFYRPYYAFRPRLNIGFGLWAGYPITYYDPYYYPYEYYPYATAQPGYTLPPSGSVNVQPDQTRMGGISFQITPDTAEVYVDGNYFGTVGQFTPTSQPLGLTAGRHHIELREPGFEVTSFDVDIVAGQVIPYSGALEN
jgi:hypothetical protein